MKKNQKSKKIASTIVLKTISKKQQIFIDVVSKMTFKMEPKIDQKSTQVVSADWPSALLNSTWPSWDDF